MRPLFIAIEKLTTNGIGIITFVTKLTCLRNIIPMMIVTILASSMLYAMPTTVDYLASIPSFVTERTDNSHGNYMVTGPGKVVVPISESGAEITDVIHYNDIRFIFDDEFNGLIKKLYFGDGSNSIANTQTNFLDHKYDVAGSSETYSLILKLYNIGGQPLYNINFTITICPLLNNQSVSEIDDNVKLTYFMSSNTDAGRKPLLFIEGFALTGSTAAASIICMNPNFFSGLLNDGYDIFILTFGSSNQNSLTSNSQYVLAALNHIQTQYNQNEVLEPVKIIGYSMGGILARLALSYAEAGNYPHMSNAVITLDSPHRGILINDNAQSLLNNTMIQAVLPDDFDEMIDAVFNSDAAKQMIRNNIMGINPSVEYGSNQYREVFGILNNSDSGGQNLLNNTGFPHQQNFVKKYAVALGSNTLSGNVNNSSNFSNIDVRFKLGMLTLTLNIAGINSVWYDKTPSSLIPMRNKYTYTICEHDWDDFLDKFLGTPKLQLIMSQSYIPPMVPTASSLCIESIPFTNGNFNSQLPTTFTIPFDGYYISPEPRYHNLIPQDASTWILNTLNAIENDPSSRMIGYASGSVTCQGNVSPGVDVSVINITTNETYNTTTNELGEYSFPLFYLSPCEYQITIAGDGYYSSKQTHSIQPNHL
ncbi:MAG: GPI inositol-deacylase, partial [Candidatus Cloacimonetes bacterium]|nr:GPI inositol-deacylase [Candidatus Cloacimonadota bacterium]